MTKRLVLSVLVAVLLVTAAILPTGVAPASAQAQLQLSDFDSTGLAVEFAAVITVGRVSQSGIMTIYSQSTNWNTAGALTEGELGITSTNVAITRIGTEDTVSSAIRMNVQPSNYDIDTYFRTGGGTDMTLYFQTTADGTPLECDVDANPRPGVGNSQTTTIVCPAAFVSAMNTAGDGTRVIFAGARAAPANPAPVVSITTSSQTVTPGQVVALAATATDPNGNDLTYQWASNGGGTFSAATSLNTNWTAPAATRNVQAIVLTLTVTDNGSPPASGDDTVTMTINALPNSPPNVSISTPSQTVNGGQNVTLSASASDPDGDSLTYQWTSNGGGVFIGGASVLNTTWRAPPATRLVQSIVLTLTVTDNGPPAPQSASASVTMTINSGPNQPPIITITTTSQTVTGGTVVNLNANATDPEGDGLSYQWTLQGGGTIANPTALNTTWTAPEGIATVQEITLTLTVTDDYNPPASASATLMMQVAIYIRPLQYSVPITLSPANNIVAGQLTPVDGDFITELKNVGVLSNQDTDIDVVNRNTGQRVPALVPLNATADPNTQGSTAPDPLVFLTPASTGQTAPATEDRIYLLDDTNDYIRAIGTDGSRHSGDDIPLGAIGAAASDWRGLAVTSSRIYAVDDATDYVRVWDRAGNRQSTEDKSLGAPATTWGNIVVTDTRIYIVDTSGVVRVWDRSWNRQTSEDLTGLGSSFRGGMVASATRLYLVYWGNNASDGLWAYGFDGTRFSGDDIHRTSFHIRGVALVDGVLVLNSGNDLFRWRLQAGQWQAASPASLTNPLSGTTIWAIAYVPGSTGNVGNAQFDFKGGIDDDDLRDWGVPLPTSGSNVTIANDSSFRYTAGSGLGFMAALTIADFDPAGSAQTHTLLSHSGTSNITLTLATNSNAQSMGTLTLAFNSANLTLDWPVSAREESIGISYRDFSSSTGSLSLAVGTASTSNTVTGQTFGITGPIVLRGGPGQEVRHFRLSRIGGSADVNLAFNPGDIYYTGLTAGGSTSTYTGYVADRSATPLPAGRATWRLDSIPNPASGLTSSPGATQTTLPAVPTPSAGQSIGIGGIDSLPQPTVTPFQEGSSIIVDPVMVASESSGLPPETWWLLLGIAIGSAASALSYKAMKSLWVAAGVGLLILIAIASINGTFGVWILVTYTFGALAVLGVHQWGAGRSG